MEIEFDFKKEESKLFGLMLRPVARVILANEGKEMAEHLYVDSGADVSLIPKSVGDWLGFLVEKEDQITEIKGVGERGVPIIIKKVTMQIEDKKFPARIAWALIEEVPLLLGRTDVFQLFDISFQKNKKISFKE